MSSKNATSKRRIAVVTGTRAEYGLLQSTMTAIRSHARLQLHTIVTGMHLLRKFGGTVKQIESDGFKVDARVAMQRGDDSATDQAKGLARGVAGIARYCQNADIDIVLVLGDRIEAMAGALAAVTTGRVLAHVHGGDLAQGDFDDALRHSITKLAHIHLPATRAAAQRIVRMGEPRRRVHLVGAPGLDRLFELKKSVRRNAKTKRAMVVYHPTGRAADREQRVMRTILHTIADAGMTPLIIHPNSDRGHTGVLHAIDRFCANGAPSGTQVFPSLPRDEFLTALIESDVLVGNSSCGMIEAPAAGTPTINIGPRQRGRQAGGATVLDTDESAAAIRRALRQTCKQGPITRPTRVYGHGGAGRKIAEILAQVRLDEPLRRKHNAY